MRITVALVLVVAIVAAVAVAHERDGESDASDTGSVTLVGDSLNVGIEPYLANELPGWSIDAHDRVGRATGEGVEELEARRATLAPVVVVSLGTNDAEGSEDDFRSLVDEAIRIVGGRCLVWATIVRDGEERTGFDAVLRDARAAHPNVRLVEWASLVAKDPSLLAGDRVHGTPEGYARRAEETARAIHAC